MRSAAEGGDEAAPASTSRIRNVSAAIIDRYGRRPLHMGSGARFTGMSLEAVLVASLLMPGSPDQAPFDLAIRHVRVIHGDGRVTPLATIFVSAGRIVRLDRTQAADGVEARRSIEASGRTIIPGLIDAHVHVEPWTLPMFLRYGVTTVRDMHNAPEYILPLAREDSPSRPRVVAAGAMLDGPGSFWENAVIVTDLRSVRAAVRQQVDAGAGVVKVYTRLKPALVAAIVQEARARDVPVAAHLGRTTATEAAAIGVTSIEHLSGIADAASANPDRLRRAHDDFLGGWTAFELEWPSLSSAALDRVAHALADKHVVIVPTLALHEAYSRLGDADLMDDAALADVPSAVLRSEWNPTDFMRRAHWTPDTLAGFKRTLPVLQHFVWTYWKIGGKVVAGTDTAQQFVVPGASLHRELELYVAAGLTPAAALRSATADAAELLGISEGVGTVDVGKDADLVLVTGDPLSDIRATQNIELVVRQGVVVR
jgi:imidazolonepropionase-like amidohydrolase